MKSRNINQETANKYVKLFLMNHTDCTQELEIITYLDNGNLSFEVQDFIMVNGRKIIRKTPLSRNEYFTYLKLSLNHLGLPAIYVIPVIVKEQNDVPVTYDICFPIETKKRTLARRKK